MMERAEILDLLSRMKALPEGAETIDPVEIDFDVERLVEDPIVTNRIAVECLQQLPPDARPDVVLACNESTKLFAYSLATAAWARFTYLDVENGGKVTGYDIQKNDKVLIVEQMVDEATSFEEAVDLIHAKKGKVFGAIALVHIGDGAPLDKDYYPLLSFSA